MINNINDLVDDNESDNENDQDNMNDNFNSNGKVNTPTTSTTTTTTCIINDNKMKLYSMRALFADRQGSTKIMYLPRFKR